MKLGDPRPPKVVPSTLDDGRAWTSIESRRVLPARDQELAARFAEAARAAQALGARLPAVLHLVRESMAGQPAAAVAHREGDDDDRDPLARLWCEDHERSVRECDRAGLVCEGIAPRAISDPVGEAAVRPDFAANDLAQIVRRAERFVQDVGHLLGLAEAYPVHAAELDKPEPDDEVGTVWCRCCWKVDKRCEPIAIQEKTGRPYYAGLCRWCGRTRAALGFDPPTWMVEKHLEGERVTPGDHELARAKAPAKAKGKRRR